MTRPLALLASLTASLILAGCAGASPQAAPAPPVAATTAPPVETLTPTPTPTGPVEYDSVVDLRDAAKAAGFACKHWKQDDVVTLALESGSCSDGDVFATFLDQADLKGQVANYKAFRKMAKEHGLEGSATLIGPNWTINSGGTGYGLQLVQAAIGGRLIRS